MDWVEVGKLIGTQGIFAGLFIWLLNKTFSKNDDREKAYHKIMNDNQQILKDNQAFIWILKRAFDTTERREVKYQEVINNSQKMIEENQEFLSGLLSHYEEFKLEMTLGLKNIREDIEIHMDECRKKGCEYANNEND